MNQLVKQFADQVPKHQRQNQFHEPNHRFHLQPAKKQDRFKSVYVQFRCRVAASALQRGYNQGYRAYSTAVRRSLAT
jgi:hypothetical protein